MTVPTEKLRLVDLALKSIVPYDPGYDMVRGDIVVQVGSYWSIHVPINIFADRYLKFQVYPPRRDFVATYLLGTIKSAKTEYWSYSSVVWPYRWVRSGSGWALLFPARAKLPVIPVKDLPPNLIKPINVGPQKDVSHRDLVKHIRESRAVAYAKAKRRSVGNRPSFPFPRFSRPNPETINWNNFRGADDYYTAWHESPVSNLRYYRAFSSVNTPGFTRLKHGKLPVNPYSLVRIQVEDHMAHDLRTCPTYAPLTSRDYGPASVWTPTVAAPEHDAAAYGKALEQLINRAELSLDGNLAQDLVQIRQTTNMIADIAVRLANANHFTKTLDFKLAWDYLVKPTTKSRGQSYRVVPRGQEPAPWKSLAENWLAFQYGWKPLLQDIDASMRSLANVMVQDPGAVRTARGKGKTLQKSRVELGLQSGYYQKTGNLWVTTYSFCTIGCRYSIDNRLKSFLAQTGFTNPVNLAWEVLPYSFVVDWFYPIGPYLTTLSAFDGLTFVDGFVSRLTKQYVLGINDFTGAFPMITNPPGAVKWDFKSRFWREYLKVDRVKLWSFPSQVQPQLKNPFSVTHALNALALLRAAFK